MARWIALVSLVFVALVVGLSLAFGGSSFEPRAGVVVLRDRLGEGDEVVSYVDDEEPAADAEERVRAAAEAAGLPVRGIGEDAEHAPSGLRLIELSTTIGRDAGFLSRSIGAEQLAPFLDRFAGPVVVEIHPYANVKGDGLVPLGGRPLRQYFRVSGPTGVAYDVPTVAVVWPFALMILLPYPLFLLARRQARRIESSDEEDVDKVHRLRTAMMALGFAVLAVFPLAAVGGGFEAFDGLVSEIAPGLTRSEFARGMGYGLLSIGFILVLMLPVVGPVAAAMRRVRGIERDRRDDRRKALRAMLLVIPWVVWVTALGVIRRGFADYSAARVGVELAAFLLFACLAPFLLLVALDTHRLDAPARERVLALAREHGVRIRDARAMRARRQKIANALILGLVPRFRYILLTDYLLDTFESDEVDAVVAHELGHAKGHHLLLKLGAFIVALVMASVLLALGVSLAPGDPNPGVLVVVVPIAFLAVLLLVQGWIGIRLEARADSFAARSQGVEPMVRALERLAEVNMVRRRTGRLWNLLGQHPGIEQRIERLRAEAERTGETEHAAAS